MVGNVGGLNLCDVAIDGVAVPDILGVGFLRIAVPFAGEDTAPANGFERAADAADSGKQVDEIEGGFALNWRIERQKLLQGVDDVGGRNGLAGFPAADGAGVHLEVQGDFGLRMVLAGGFQIGQYGVIAACGEDGCDGGWG